MINNFDRIFKKIIRKHLVPLVVVFLLANTSVGIIIFTRSRAQSCMTQGQIDSDARCLYVYQGHVYEKGTRENPHKGQPCGINVDAIIPNLHFVGNILTQFNSARVAPFCVTIPTASPTQAPVVPTVAPTQMPTVPPIGGGVPTMSPTQVPTQAPEPTNVNTIPPIQIPTQAPISTPTLSPLPEVDAGITFEKVIVTNTPSPRAIVKPLEGEGFDLTKISKPAIYTSLALLLGTILLVLYTSIF